MNKIYSKMFGWMFVGLLVTFITGYIVSTNEIMVYNIFSSNWNYLIIVLIEFALAITLTARIRKMQPITAIVLFLLY